MKRKLLIRFECSNECSRHRSTTYISRINVGCRLKVLKYPWTAIEARVVLDRNAMLMITKTDDRLTSWKLLWIVVWRVWKEMMLNWKECTTSLAPHIHWRKLQMNRAIPVQRMCDVRLGFVCCLNELTPLWRPNTQIAVALPTSW